MPRRKWTHAGLAECEMDACPGFAEAEYDACRMCNRRMPRVSESRIDTSSRLTACGKTHAAFDRRCIPAEPPPGELATPLRSVLRCVSVEIHSVFLPHAPCQPDASPVSALTRVSPQAVNRTGNGRMPRPKWTHAHSSRLRNGRMLLSTPEGAVRVAICGQKVMLDRDSAALYGVEVAGSGAGRQAQPGPVPT